MTKIKICGLRRLEDVSYVNEVLPDYVGFVFWEKSKRNVSFDFAKEMRKALDSRIKTVGVFVDRDIEDIVHLCDEKIISVVQLHGKETDETVEKIRQRVEADIEIIKAFEVNEERDIILANQSKADKVLIDSGKGSGSTFDWTLLNKINRDYFLAGGLSVENVSEAIKELDPYAVDVSSKVETDGFKDREKIIAFCNEVKNTQLR